MKSKLRALCISIAAVVAMSALASTVAQAAQFTLSEGSYPVAGTGEQTVKHVFTVQGQKVECSKAHFEGFLTEPSSDLTVTPTYSGCTAFGIANAQVNMNSCKYTVTVDGGTEPNYTGSMHLVCSTEGDSITVNAPATNPLCALHIPAQTPTNNKVSYIDTGNGTVHVKSEVSGIHSNVTDIGGFFCPLSNASTDSSGTYTGSGGYSVTEAGKKGHIG